MLKIGLEQQKIFSINILVCKCDLETAAKQTATHNAVSRCVSNWLRI